VRLDILHGRQSRRYGIAVTNEKADLAGIDTGGRRAGASPILRKIALFLTPSPAEQAVLAQILRNPQVIGPQTELLSDTESLSHFFVFESGWAVREKHLSDGRRQILNLVLPGDCPGLRASLFGMQDERLVTISEATVYAVNADDILTLFRTQPKMAAAVAWSAAREEAILADHIVSLGRRTAYERIAHLFLELYQRLDAVGQVAEYGFRFPVTQEILSDLLGLSLVHVNRTLRRLREDGLVRVEAGVVRFEDIQRLRAISEFASPHLDPRQAPRQLHRTLAALEGASSDPSPGSHHPKRHSNQDD